MSSLVKKDVNSSSVKPNVVVACWNIRFSLKFHRKDKMSAKVGHILELLSGEKVHVLALQEAPGTNRDSEYKLYDDFNTALGEEIAKKSRELGRTIRHEPVLTGGESAVFIWDDDAYGLERIGVMFGGRTHPTIKTKKTCWKTKSTTSHTTTWVDGKPDHVTCIFIENNSDDREFWLNWKTRDPRYNRFREDWIERPPAALILKHLTSGSYLGILSAHLKSKDNRGLDQTRKEAHMLSHAADHLAAEIEALGGGAVMVLGDFNLGPPGDLREGSAPRDAWQRLSECGFRCLVDSGGGTVSSNIAELVKGGGHLYDNIWIKTIGSDSSFVDGARAKGRVHKMLDACIFLDVFKRRVDAALDDLKRHVTQEASQDFFAHWSDHWPVIAETLPELPLQARTRGAAVEPRAPLLARLWWWLRVTMILVVYAAFAGACLGFTFGGRRGGLYEL